MPKYIIAFRRNDLVGQEEYDGGFSLKDARSEAAFFKAHLPEWVEVRICTVNGIGRLTTVEFVKAERLGCRDA